MLYEESERSYSVEKEMLVNPQEEHNTEQEEESVASRGQEIEIPGPNLHLTSQNH